jgi:glycosyltransferase involved in cell wall biosynthesis
VETETRAESNRSPLPVHARPLGIGVSTALYPPEFIGGTEIRASIHAKYLARMGNRVVVFTRRVKGTGGTESRDGYLIRRRRVVDLPLLRFVFDLLFAVWDVFRHRKELDVMISYMFVINGVITALAKKLFGIPYLVWIRDEISYRIGENLRKSAFVPMVIRNAGLFLVQSEARKDHFLEELSAYGFDDLRAHVAPRIHVIDDGVEVPESGVTPGDELVFVGRLDPIKGVDLLIEAMKGLPQEYPLWIVGDGPERAKLERLASGLNVRFAGMVTPEEVPNWLRRARALVLPSHSEGLPGVMMETMALGIPVIATRVGAIPEVVKDGENGLLLDPGDVETLKAHIETVMKDPDRTGRMGLKARASVQGRSWASIMPAVEAHLRELATPSLDVRENPRTGA